MFKYPLRFLLGVAIYTVIKTVAYALMHQHH